MKFDIYGPYELLRDNTGNLIRKETRDDFNAQLQAVTQGNTSLTDACGCYVFAIRSRRGTLPWYVGKTVRNIFSKECMNEKNINTFNEFLRGRDGAPVLYVLPKLTQTERFAKPAKGKSISPNAIAIDSLETILIYMALKRNQNLSNIQKTAMLRNLEVRGFLNARLARGGCIKELRNVFGI